MIEIVSSPDYGFPIPADNIFKRSAIARRADQGWWGMLLALRRQRDAKGRKRVVVLSRDISLASMLKCTLNMEGFDVIEACGTKDAVSEFGPVIPDLAITVLSPPGLSELSFIRAIRRGNALRPVPVLVITAEADLGRQMEWREAGATGWITLPFTAAQLMDMVDTLVFNSEGT